jgi:hypothetical protein
VSEKWGDERGLLSMDVRPMRSYGIELGDEVIGAESEMRSRGRRHTLAIHAVTPCSHPPTKLRVRTRISADASPLSLLSTMGSGEHDEETLRS